MIIQQKPSILLQLFLGGKNAKVKVSESQAMNMGQFL